MSTIEWTNETWNPITGCKTDVQFHPERIEQPLWWRKPRMVFVNSMSDLFHESVTDNQLDQIFAVMALTPQHTYQALTKRPERMLEYFNSGVYGLRTFTADWIADDQARKLYSIADGLGLKRKPLPNVWLGVTVENQRTADERIPLLLQTPAAVRLLSCEPLLEGVDLSPFQGIRDNGDPQGGEVITADWLWHLDWVIVGGESGPKARICSIDWIESIVEQCKEAGVACFVKQLGSNAIARSDMGILDLSNTRGKANNPDEWPEPMPRQFPPVATSPAS